MTQMHWPFLPSGKYRTGSYLLLRGIVRTVSSSSLSCDKLISSNVQKYFQCKLMSWTWWGTCVPDLGVQSEWRVIHGGHHFLIDCASFTRLLRHFSRNLGNAWTPPCQHGPLGLFKSQTGSHVMPWLDASVRRKIPVAPTGCFFGSSSRLLPLATTSLIIQEVDTVNNLLSGPILTSFACKEQRQIRRSCGAGSESFARLPSESTWRRSCDRCFFFMKMGERSLICHPSHLISSRHCVTASSCCASTRYPRQVAVVFRMRPEMRPLGQLLRHGQPKIVDSRGISDRFSSPDDTAHAGKRDRVLFRVAEIIRHLPAKRIGCCGASKRGKRNRLRGCNQQRVQVDEGTQWTSWSMMMTLVIIWIDLVSCSVCFFLRDENVRGAGPHVQFPADRIRAAPDCANSLLTAGRRCRRFAKSLTDFWGAKHLLTNSVKRMTHVTVSTISFGNLSDLKIEIVSCGFRNILLDETWRSNKKTAKWHVSVID